MILNNPSENIILERGCSFQNANPCEVIDFLKERKINYHFIAPEYLRIIQFKKKLFLEIHTEKVLRYPIRKSFFEKLLMWYKISTVFAYKAETDVIVSMLNNVFKLIKRNYVRVVIENGQALTITSPDYTDIRDKDIIKNLSNNKLVKITRTDMFTKIDTNEIRTINPVPNDTCGMGLSVFNSETGFHKFGVNMYLLRYICNNGATLNMDILNKNIPHYKQVFDSGNIKSVIVKTLNNFYTKYGEIQRKFEKATDFKLATSKIIEVNKKIDFVLGYKKSNYFLKDFKNGLQPNSTIFDIFNFITDKAKIYEPNTRLRLEELAGDIILN